MRNDRSGRHRLPLFQKERRDFLGILGVPAGRRDQEKSAEEKNGEGKRPHCFSQRKLNPLAKNRRGMVSISVRTAPEGTVPIYEYTCQKCKQHFSLLQSLSSRPEETACPHCGEKKSQRLFSTFASKTNGENVASPAPSGGHCHTGGCGCG